MRGIFAWGSYLPYRRLDRRSIGEVVIGGGGTGTRTVASYDEDTTTMAVAAAGHALSSASSVSSAGTRPRSLWFATTRPAYLDKTNATAVHAALRLDRTVGAYDAIGSVRSALGALRAGLAGAGPSLVVASDLRVGLPGGPDEAAGGDGAAALVVGPADAGPLLAEIVAWTSLTEEFVDRWRTPGAPASRQWEERFGEIRYTELGTAAFKTALDDAAITPEEIDRLIVAGTHGRATEAVAKTTGVPAGRIARRMEAVMGNPGAAQPALLLAAALEDASPGETVVLVVLADGADVLVVRTTEALAGYRPVRTVAGQLATGAPVAYGTYLAWRGLLTGEPPRRPAPARPSAPAASRNRDWKFGLVGSMGEGGGVTLPPSPLDDRPYPLAGVTGTITAVTVDRLVHSPSPPVVFAIVDFDGGGRLPMEVTDVEPDEVGVGDRVEATFRCLYVADGIHNYFWKARPVRDEER